MHRRHLDVIADHVVVADLQRRHGGRRAVFRLQPGHRLAAVVTQGALLVELGAIARADETAIAGEERRLVGQCRRQCVDQHAMIGARRHDLGQRGGRRRQRFALGAQRLGQGLGRDETIAQSQKIARAATTDGEPLQSAFDIGRAFQRLAHPLAHAGALDEELHQIEAPIDLLTPGEGGCNPFGQ